MLFNLFNNNYYFHFLVLEKKSKAIKFAINTELHKNLPTYTSATTRTLANHSVNTNVRKYECVCVCALLYVCVLQFGMHAFYCYFLFPCRAKYKEKKSNRLVKHKAQVDGNGRSNFFLLLVVVVAVFVLLFYYYASRKQSPKLAHIYFIHIHYSHTVNCSLFLFLFLSYLCTSFNNILIK